MNSIDNEQNSSTLFRHFQIECSFFELSVASRRMIKLVSTFIRDRDVKNFKLNFSKQELAKIEIKSKDNAFQYLDELVVEK